MAMSEMDYMNGGGFSEFKLWTNPNPPTAGTDNFNTQSITLSDDITNYELIKIVYKRTANIDESFIIIPADALAMSSYESGYYVFYLGFNGRSNGVLHPWFRRFYSPSNTIIQFDDCKAADDLSLMYNNRLYPLEVIGMK